jgi:hypothetical protein
MAKCCDFEQRQILKRGHELGELSTELSTPIWEKLDRVFPNSDYLQGKLEERQAARHEDSQCLHGMPLTGQDEGTVKSEEAALPVLAPSVIIAGFPPNDRQYGTRKKL